jgi:hypothetical protein
VTSARTDAQRDDHRTLLQDVASQLLNGGWREHVTLLGMGENRIFTDGWPRYVPTADALMDHRGNYGLKSGHQLHLDIDLHEDLHFGERAVMLAQGCAALARDVCGYRVGVLRARDADRATMALVYPLTEHHQGIRTLVFWVKPPKGGGPSVKAQIEFRTGAGDSGTGAQLCIAGPHPKGGVVLPDIRPLDDSDVVDGETLERLQAEMFRLLSEHSWVEKVEWKGTKPQTRAQREAADAASREQYERLRAQSHQQFGSAGSASRWSSYLHGMLPGVCEEISATTEPGRNQALFIGAAHAFGFLKGAGLEEQRASIRAELANAGLATGLAAAEVEDCLNNAWNHAEPWLPEDRPPPPQANGASAEGAYDERVPHTLDQGSPAPPAPSGPDATGPQGLAESPPAPLLLRRRTFRADDIGRKPEPVKTLWGNFIVAGQVNVLAGAGGTGKTTLLSGLALAGAAGVPFMERPTQPFSTVVVSTEDDDEAYLRKLHTWRDVIPRWKDADGRIHHLDLRGADFQLVRGSRSGRRLEVDVGCVERLASDIRTLVPDGDVFVPMETVSRLSGGEEGNEGAIKLVSALELLIRTTGVTPVLVAHTGKDQARNRVVDQYAARNASALTDNARSFLVLSRPPKDDGDERPDRDLPDHEDFFGLYHAKHNHTRKERVLYLERHTEEGLDSAYFTRWVRPLRPMMAEAPGASPEALQAAQEVEVGGRLRTLVLRLTRPLPDGSLPDPVMKSNLRDNGDHRQALGLKKGQVESYVDEALRAGFLRHGPRTKASYPELLPGAREA